MPHKFQGTLNDGSKIIVLNENSWEVEKCIDGIPSSYEMKALTSGTKTIFAERSDGEFIGYGQVNTNYYRGNHFGDRSLGCVQFGSNDIFW